MSHTTTKKIAPKIVVCPECKGDSVYSTQNIYRPFCSQRCKNIDLGAWASESFRMATDTSPENADSDDPQLQ